MPIKSLYARESNSSKSESSFREGSCSGGKKDSQLAVRADADENLGVAAHSRLEDGKRAVGHLPVFLGGSDLSAGVLLCWRAAGDVRVVQSHTRCLGASR